jgi:hypothetical protein
MKSGNIYCQCGHAIVSHNPAGETFACCVRSCGCTQFTRPERAETLAAMESIVDDFFAFQAAACTTQADCQCGRHERA